MPQVKSDLLLGCRISTKCNFCTNLAHTQNSSVPAKIIVARRRHSATRKANAFRLVLSRHLACTKMSNPSATGAKIRAAAALGTCKGINFNPISGRKFIKMTCGFYIWMEKSLLDFLHRKIQ